MVDLLETCGAVAALFSIIGALYAFQRWLHRPSRRRKEVLAHDHFHRLLKAYSQYSEMPDVLRVAHLWESDRRPMSSRELDEAIMGRSLWEVLRSCDRGLCLLGYPGSGKTVALGQLMFRLAATAHDAGGYIDQSTPVPVFLSLEGRQLERLASARSLRALATEAFENDAGLQGLKEGSEHWDFLSDLSRSGYTPLLIIDGIDSLAANSEAVEAVRSVVRSVIDSGGRVVAAGRSDVLALNELPTYYMTGVLMPDAQTAVIEYAMKDAPAFAQSLDAAEVRERLAASGLDCGVCESPLVLSMSATVPDRVVEAQVAADIFDAFASRVIGRIRTAARVHPATERVWLERLVALHGLYECSLRVSGLVEAGDGWRGFVGQHVQLDIALQTMEYASEHTHLMLRTSESFLPYRLFHFALSEYFAGCAVAESLDRGDGWAGLPELLAQPTFTSILRHAARRIEPRSRGRLFGDAAEVSVLLAAEVASQWPADFALDMSCLYRSEQAGEAFTILAQSHPSAARAAEWLAQVEDPESAVNVARALAGNEAHVSTVVDWLESMDPDGIDDAGFLLDSLVRDLCIAGGDSRVAFWLRRQADHRGLLHVASGVAEGCSDLELLVGLLAARPDEGWSSVIAARVAELEGGTGPHAAQWFRQHIDEKYVGRVARKLAAHEATAPLAARWLADGENSQGDPAAGSVVRSPHVKDFAARLLRESPQGKRAYALAAGLARVPEYRALSIAWLEGNASDPGAGTVAYELAQEPSASDSALRWLLGAADTWSAVLVFGELLDYDSMHEHLLEWADSISHHPAAYFAYKRLARCPAALSQVVAWVQGNWDDQSVSYVITEIVHADCAFELMERWLAEHPGAERADYCEMWLRTQGRSRTRM